MSYIKDNILHIETTDKPTYFSLPNDECYPEAALEILDEVKIEYKEARIGDTDMPPVKDIPQLAGDTCRGINEKKEYKTNISFQDLKDIVNKYIFDIEEGSIKKVVVE